MRLDLDVRIDVAQTIAGRLDLPPAEVFRAVNDLTLKVRLLDDVEIDDADAADSRRGQIHAYRRAESARADHQHARRLHFSLSLHADFRHDQVTAVTHDLFVRQLRQVLAHFRLDHRAARNRGNDHERVAVFHR